MKKLVASLLLMSIIVLINAQEPPTLPGNNSILTSKNGVPVLPEAGDIAFGINAGSLLSIFKDVGSTPSFDFITDNVFTFKYFLADKSALRSWFRINTELDDQDQYEETDINIVLGMGWEKRVGKSRVQGFFGPGGGVTYSKQLDRDPDGTTTFDVQVIGVVLGGFIGAEYFIAPKLSLGGQFNWGLEYRAETNNITESKHNTLIIDLDNYDGAIVLTFHF